MRDHAATVHTMPLDVLRVRAREARRLLDQAHAIVRASFDRDAQPDSTAEKQVGALLDAIERLLPGIAAVCARRSERDPERHDRRDSAFLPAERDHDTAAQRAAIATSLADGIALLLLDIERGRTSKVIPVAIESTRDVAPRRS